MEQIIAYIKAYVKKNAQPCINQEIKLLQDGKEFLHYAKRREILHTLKWGWRVIHDCRNLVHVCEHVLPGDELALAFE